MPFLDKKSVFRSMKPQVLYKAFQTFDKYMTIVVASCWAAAFVAVLVALYAVWLSGVTKKEMTSAEGMEPTLPQIVIKKPERADLAPLVERLQRNFSELSISMGNDQALTITGIDGSRFRIWLTALSYIDTISPQYRWTIKEFCVGSKCPTGDFPMRAVLAAEKISFTVPTEVK